MFKLPSILKRGSSVQVTQKKKKGPFWLVALVLSIIAGVAVYWTFISIYKPVPVVVPATDLDQFHKIQSSDIKVVSTSRRDLHPLAFHSKDAIVNTYTRVPLYKDEPILEPKVIRNLEQMIDIKKDMGNNETIITLKQNEIRWPSVIQDGDLVSIKAVYDNEVVEITKQATIVSSNGSLPVISKLTSSAQGDVQSSTNDKITFIIDKSAANELLKAICFAKMVYMFPEDYQGQ